MSATTSSRTKIERTARHAQPAVLEPNYGVWVGGAWLICAYGEEADVLKRRFLDHGAAYLRAIGQSLSTEGFTEMLVQRNPAGIAVSGDVYAEYWHPGLTCWLYAWLSASSLRIAGESRPDGLVLVARKREQQGTRVEDGPNHFFLPGDSVLVARELLPIVGLSPTTPAPLSASQLGLFE